MKKIFCILLLGVLLFMLCACGNQSTSPDASTTELYLDPEALLNVEEIQKHDCEIHGHVFSKPTCQKAATCYYCGMTQGSVGAHDFTHATCLAKAICTVCGMEKGGYADHVFTKATCAAPASCTVCGITSGSALAHNWQAATCLSPSMCSGCMKKQGSALGHVWTGGSCTEGKVCSRCGRRTEAPGHKMTKGSCTEDAVCTVCGYTEKAKGHTFENGVCTVCGKTTGQAQADDATRTTVLPTTEIETTQEPVDIELLESYGTRLAALLEQAHTDADDAIGLAGEESRKRGQAAVDGLRSCMELTDEAIEYCSGDARLKSAAEKLTAIQNAIRKSAGIQSFSDAEFIKTMVTVRADCTAGSKACTAYQNTLQTIR